MTQTKFFSLAAGSLTFVLPAFAVAATLNVDINGRRDDPPQDPPGITYSGPGPAGGSFVGVVADSDPSRTGVDNDAQTFSYTNLGGSGINFSIGNFNEGGDNNQQPTDPTALTLDRRARAAYPARSRLVLQGGRITAGGWL